jgi:sulfhydrogenase subunit beta (sulfur reductase)
MAVEKKLLKKESLGSLVLKFREEGKRILAPVKIAGRADFASVSSLADVTDDYITTLQSAKAMLFPRVERLFEAEMKRGMTTLSNKPENGIVETVLLGARPCDAAGITALSAIFSWGGDDPLFTARRDKSLIISVSCARCDDKCFCTSVGGGPGNTEGSDLLLTRMEGGDFLAEIITDKARDLAGRYPGLFSEAPDVDKRALLADVPAAFDVKAVMDNVRGSFDDPLWLGQSLRCIGCGACAFVCPACACFDIQDARKGARAVRKRSWDSCGFSLFTLHGSGHNPRTTQDSRWRQRVLHKFAYMPERQQVLGCSGCGRCGRSCPVDMNLKEHLAEWAGVLKQ